MKRNISFFFILMYALVSIRAVPLDATTQMCGTGTFGINISNNSPGDNSIYIYGPTNDSSFLDPYSGLSLGPFDAGGSYTIIMYANHHGEHSYRFNGESETNSTGWATFNFACLDSNSSASITLN